jgi:hypothetical protein
VETLPVPLLKTKRTLASKLPICEGSVSVAMRNKPSLRRDWLTNLQWVMLNQIEFLFNH